MIVARLTPSSRAALVTFQSALFRASRSECRARQIGHVDHRAIAADQRLAQDSAHLALIAGPIIVTEQRHRLIGDLGRVGTVLRQMSLDDIGNLALSQGGQVQHGLADKI